MFDNSDEYHGSKNVRYSQDNCLHVSYSREILSREDEITDAFVVRLKIGHLSIAIIREEHNASIPGSWLSISRQY